MARFNLVTTATSVWEMLMKTRKLVLQRSWFPAVIVEDQVRYKHLFYVLGFKTSISDAVRHYKEAMLVEKRVSGKS